MLLYYLPSKRICGKQKKLTNHLPCLSPRIIILIDLVLCHLVSEIRRNWSAHGSMPLKSLFLALVEHNIIHGHKKTAYFSFSLSCIGA
jgi:hypothetical protein